MVMVDSGTVATDAFAEWIASPRSSSTFVRAACQLEVNEVQSGDVVAGLSVRCPAHTRFCDSADFNSNTPRATP